LGTAYQVDELALEYSVGSAHLHIALIVFFFVVVILILRIGNHSCRNKKKMIPYLASFKPRLRTRS